jgi:hypothetical protein
MATSGPSSSSSSRTWSQIHASWDGLEKERRWTMSMWNQQQHTYEELREVVVDILVERNRLITNRRSGRSWSG